MEHRAGSSSPAPLQGFDDQRNPVFGSTSATSAASNFVLTDSLAQPLQVESLVELSNSRTWSIDTQFSVPVCSDAPFSSDSCSSSDSYATVANLVADSPHSDSSSRMEDKIARYKRSIERVAFSVEDDITPFLSKKISSEGLRKRQELALTYREALQDAHLFLHEHAGEGYSNELKEKVAGIRKAIVDFLLFVEECLEQAEAEATAERESDLRAQSRKQEALKGKVKDVLRELERVSLLADRVKSFKPTSEDDLFVLIERHKNADQSLAAAISSSDAAAKLVLDHDLVDEYTEIEKTTSMVKSLKLVIDTHLENEKKNIGFWEYRRPSSHVNVPMPLFDGHLDQLSIYEFEEAWLKYRKSCGLSHAESADQLKLAVKKSSADITRLTSEQEIFAELKIHFGNPLILLKKKEDEVKSLDLCKGNDYTRRDWLVKAKSLLEGLQDMCKKHHIEDYLTRSSIASDLQAKLPFDFGRDFKKQLKKHLSSAGVLPLDIVVEELVAFLDDKITDCTLNISLELAGSSSEKKSEPKSANDRPKQVNRQFNPRHAASSDVSRNNPRKQGYVVNRLKDKSCVHCGEPHDFLFYCPEYIKAPVSDRFNMALKQQVCVRCLNMNDRFAGKKAEWWPEHKTNCSTTFQCRKESCASRDANRQYHVTLCAKHVNDNKKVEAAFIRSLDPGKLPEGADAKTVRFFHMSSFLHSGGSSSPQESYFTADGTEILPDVSNNAIFMMQTVPSVQAGKDLLVFYDTGCSSASLSNYAFGLLETKNVRKGPTVLDVASGQSVQIPYGEEQFQLKLDGGYQKATITGLRMNQITSQFPLLSLKDAWNDCLKEVPTSKRRVLPEIDHEIGGREVDIMLGVRYLKYFPELVFTLPSGLSIYKARLRSASGCQAVLGGPHAAWDLAVEKSQYMNPRMYLTMEARAFCAEQAWVRVNQQKFLLMSEPEEGGNVEAVPFCGKDCDAEGSEANDGRLYAASITHAEKQLWRLENLGTESTYRCVNCRHCSACKEGESLEMISIREEREQCLIEKSVRLLPEENKVIASLPFVQNPAIALKENRHIAERVFRTQLDLFKKNPTMKADVLRSHQKLVDRGYVLSACDLPKEKRDQIEGSPGHGYFIPWRVVFNEGSLSTPCRMVFDASSKTPGGDSLNGILAKGVNKLVKLQDLLLRFRAGPYALTADISMAYNGTWLCDEHLKYQRYLWKDDLDPLAPTKVMYVATLIYGVKSSGQQCQASLEKLAEFFMSQGKDCQAGAQVLKRNVYVDDIISSCQTQDECHEIAQDVARILDKGSMKVKGFTFSGQDPNPQMSGDGISVGLAGYVWQSRIDCLSLNIGLPRLGKAKRGKKPDPISGDFAEALRPKFTRRILTGMVAGVFDPLGLVTPITAGMKLQLHELCKLGLDWDDQVPSELLPVWARIMEQIQELRNVTFERAIVPPNAKEIRIDLLVAVDASQYLGVVAVYARIPLVDGSYSCQLVMGRSKILSGLTVPRAELKSAVVGAITAQVVRRNFGPVAGDVMFVTDSTIALHWITQDDRPLRTGVRNAVLEIRRLSNVDQWFHVDGDLNVADLGTRRAEVSEVMPDSWWQHGMPWMGLKVDQMPIKTIGQVILSAEDRRQAAVEMKARDIQGHVYSAMRSHVADRYGLSQYLVDPCRFRWSKSVRIMALTLKFVECCGFVLKGPRADDVNVFSYSSAKGTIALNQAEIRAAEEYFFKKATNEVLHFSSKKDYEHISTMVDGVLLFNGRILGTQDVQAFAEVMFDLTPVTFCKPIIDRYSPVAYSVMTEVHWKHNNHLSTARTLRESLGVVFVLHGWSLAKEVRRACAFCRRFKARVAQVEMGPIHDTRLAIAPPFYHCQVDLLGPFKAQCEHNHRSSVKVWGVIFKDPASGAVFVHAMAKYNTSQFVMAYTRFAARFGHPRRLFPDEGSQLVSGCKNMEFSWLEVNRTLGARHGVGVEFVPCSVGGHNAHGMVERSIREVRRLFDSVYRSCKLDILGFETAFSWISNELNNLPICLGSRFQDLDNLDLLTPNRLIQGKNNSRALSGCCTVPRPSQMLERMNQVFESWWKAWYEERLSEFVAKPRKWFRSDPAIKVQDVVIFQKVGSEQVLGEPIWRIGRVSGVEKSKDGKVRTVVIEYKNCGENVFRKTRRAARTVAVLFSEDELDLVQEINAAARMAEKDILGQSQGIDQQIAVARDVQKCHHCSGLDLCLVHQKFFEKRPWLKFCSNRQDLDGFADDSGVEVDHDPLAEGNVCLQGLCTQVGIHDDPWETHVVGSSRGAM